ncbi:hypothetical protein, partial [Escherichia coli]|uniref:hypothetical protein n=1 Tax=Escherichia coli TaxID=562 RepID=UPI001BAF177A
MYKGQVFDFLGQTLTLSEFTIGCVFFLLLLFYFLFHVLWMISEKIIKSRKKVGSVGDLNLFVLVL